MTPHLDLGHLWTTHCSLSSLFSLLPRPDSSSSSFLCYHTHSPLLFRSLNKLSPFVFCFPFSCGELRKRENPPSATYLLTRLIHSLGHSPLSLVLYLLSSHLFVLCSSHLHYCFGFRKTHILDTAHSHSHPPIPSSGTRENEKRQKTTTKKKNLELGKNNDV